MLGSVALVEPIIDTVTPRQEFRLTDQARYRQLVSAPLTLEGIKLVALGFAQCSIEDNRVIIRVGNKQIEIDEEEPRIL